MTRPWHAARIYACLCHPWLALTGLRCPEGGPTNAGYLTPVAARVRCAHITRQRPRCIRRSSQIVCRLQPGRRVEVAQDRRVALGQRPFGSARMELQGAYRLSPNGGEADDHAVALRRGEGEVVGPLVEPRVEEAWIGPR